MHFLLITGYALNCYTCKVDKNSCEDIEDTEARRCKDDQNFCTKTVINGGKTNSKKIRFHTARIQKITEKNI